MLCAKYNFVVTDVAFFVQTSFKKFDIPWTKLSGPRLKIILEQLFTN